MNRVTSGFAIGTLALFAATGFALAQSTPDAAATGAPPPPAAQSAAPAPAEQMSPADQPAQAGGMQNTSAMKSDAKKGCEKPTDPKAAAAESSKIGIGCEKPK